MERINIKNCRCPLGVLLLLVSLPAHALPVEDPQQSARTNNTGWTVMPTGARSAFVGIHGGTMPVSLLVNDDGSSLISFVGRTGNDFLEEMRSKTPIPSALNATIQRSEPVDGVRPESGRPSLTAGGDAGSLPVIRGAHITSLAEHLQPFGFSDKPLSIEGSVTKPLQLSPSKQYLPLFQPQYLQPRK